MPYVVVTGKDRHDRKPAGPHLRNLITSLLGFGKTTAILHLLEHRPQGEKWAALVIRLEVIRESELGCDEIEDIRLLLSSTGED